eukprot:CAMPEP_0116011188 /NCGR_PEP_ID=MMETSP0321-20121206/4425_1 /TAXON_ID=163516 /ORGANISM="Leptocylindrus danicus var. danicus, Strain B650" /LENGTH=247 /DNA_ID=CAMNT_0003480385 /DNA_START=3 /DNA_END=745 /DNA_ORIENTATION=+
MTYGQPLIGTDCGPAMLREAGLRSKLTALGWAREAGLRSKLTALGWRVEDLNDLNFEQITDVNGALSKNSKNNKAKNSIRVGKSAEMIANVVCERASMGRFPLVLGGDHSVAIGSLAGILKARPRTGVLWIDAHADLNTPDISGSGNMHGMPVGLLMEEMCSTEDLQLRPDSIAYVALRDVDLEERVAIRELGIAAFTMMDIDRYGIGAVMDMALSHLLKDDPTRPIHLSYDIDAIDPGLAPATGTA